MREAPRELGEGFAVYSAELKRAAIRLHVYGHYRPVVDSHQRQHSGTKIRAIQTAAGSVASLLCTRRRHGT